MMDGRVRTLHPKVHGGLLGRRQIDDAVMARYGIDRIDLLVVSHIFEKMSGQSMALEKLIEYRCGGSGYNTGCGKKFQGCRGGCRPVRLPGSN